MLDFLNGRPSDATLRKFACACCRRIWDLIDSDLQRRAIEVGVLAERSAADARGRHLGPLIEYWLLGWPRHLSGTFGEERLPERRR
jgi:hypothetical protein